MSQHALTLTKEWLNKGVSYAMAQQKAADAILGEKSYVFETPNNVLGIEYIKALKRYNSTMHPITVKRTGGDHDSDTGYSASALRKSLNRGKVPVNLMTKQAALVSKEEIKSGRGPVTMEKAELAVLSRLRALDDYFDIPGMSEGLERRFQRYAVTESSINGILTKAKTKRYPMSRLRRILMCAALGVTVADAETLPPYARVLAMNKKGMMLLNKARGITKLPIITKPAAVNKLDKSALRIFNLEASATDFFVLAYQDEKERSGGQEWRQSPIIIE